MNTVTQQLNTVRVRRARISDIMALVAMIRMLMEERTRIRPCWQVVRDGISRIMNDETLGAYYVARIDRRIVGMMLLTPFFDDVTNADSLVVRRVFVRPKFRRRGVNAALFNKIGSVAVETQAKDIQLICRRDNADGIQAFTACGMEADAFRFRLTVNASVVPPVVPAISRSQSTELVS